MNNIIGAGGGKGGGGGHESDDTLFSTAYIEVIDAVSEGDIQGLPFGGKGLYLDDTPITAQDGSRNHNVLYEKRNGGQTQAPFNVVQSVSTETQINIKVEKETPAVHTINDSNADYAVVTLGFPRLMSIDGNGNINGTQVEFKIECQPSGGSYVVVSRPGKVTKGTKDTVNNWWLSPDGTYLADVYVDTGGASDTIDIEHSTNGIDWTVVDTVTTELNGQSIFGQLHMNRYTGAARVTLDEGVHYLRWAGITTPFNSWNFNAVQWTAYDVAGTIKLDGKTGSRYQRQFRFPLAGSAPWNIKVTRVTDDSTSSKLANDLYFDTLRTEIVARLNYPNTALIYWKIPAKEFSSVPTRKSLIDGIKVRVPVNYDPATRAYDGVWNGSFKTVWTDNPAWIFYDLCIEKRYGIGRYVSASAIDKWALYDIAQYCDELVDSGKRDSEGAVIYEPRFTCNIQIIDARAAFDWLRDMASVFRGMLYVINGQITATCDQPSDPVQLFTTSNVIDGQFRFQGTGALARKTVKWVKWRDPEDMYNEKYEYVQASSELITRYGLNVDEVTAIGCTSRGQAHRLGKYLLLDGEACIFSVSHDAAFVQPGDIVQCAIPLRSNAKRLGGRIISIDSVTVVIDAPVLLTAGHDYQLSVMTADGTTESKNLAVVAETGETATLTLASAFSAELVDHAIWVLVDLDGIQPTQWRVISIQDAETGITKTITAVSHDVDKYTSVDNFDTDITASLIPSFTDTNVTPPGTITIENLSFTDKNGAAQNKLHVSWLQSAKAVRYQLRWRYNNGQWQKTVPIVGTLFDMIIKHDGDYDFEVLAINALGKQSAPATASATIVGDSTFLFDQSITLDVSSDETYPTVVSKITLTTGFYDVYALLGCGDPTHTATLALEDITGAALVTLTSDGGVKEVSTSSPFEVAGTVDLDIVIYGSDADAVTVLKKVRIVRS